MATKKNNKEPNIEYPHGQNLFSINAQNEEIEKFQPEILNTVNKNGHGNDAEVVGMVSQVIKDYRAQDNQPSLEKWIKYHEGLTNIQGIDVGVNKNWEEFKKMRKAIMRISEKTIRLWLENLVYNKTFVGLQAQDMILSDITNRLNTEKGQGYSYKNGDSSDERAQIDGYIISPDDKYCGLQIKSDSYRSHNTVEGSAPVAYVYYKLKKEGLYYDFDLDNLKFYDKTEYEKYKPVTANEENEQSIVTNKKAKTQSLKMAIKKAEKALEMATKNASEAQKDAQIASDYAEETRQEAEKASTAVEAAKKLLEELKKQCL